MKKVLDNQVATPGYKTTSPRRNGDNNNLGTCLKIPAVPTAPTRLENDHHFSWAVLQRTTFGLTYGQVHPSHHHSKNYGQSSPLPIAKTITFWAGQAKSYWQSARTIGNAATTTANGTRKRQ